MRPIDTSLFLTTFLVIIYIGNATILLICRSGHMTHGRYKRIGMEHTTSITIALSSTIHYRLTESLFFVFFYMLILPCLYIISCIYRRTYFLSRLFF